MFTKTLMCELCHAEIEAEGKTEAEVDKNLDTEIQKHTQVCPGTDDI